MQILSSIGFAKLGKNSIELPIIWRRVKLNTTIWTGIIVANVATFRAKVRVKIGFPREYICFFSDVSGAGGYLHNGINKLRILVDSKTSISDGAEREFLSIR